MFYFSSGAQRMVGGMKKFKREHSEAFLKSSYRNWMKIEVRKEKMNKIENDGRNATREPNRVSNAVEEGITCRRIEFEFTTRKDLGYIS